MSPICTPTHISGHTLDLILFPTPVLSSDPPIPNITVFPPDSPVTDHSLLITSLPTLKTNQTSEAYMSRDYSKFVSSKFYLLLTSLLPINLFYSLDPSDSLPLPSSSLTSINNFLFPLSHHSPGHRRYSPWNSADLSSFKRSQRSLERIWRRTGYPDVWTNF